MIFMATYILTDSSADFFPDEAQRRGIWIAPLKVRFGEEDYQSGADPDYAGFFSRMESARELPATSQAGPDDFLPWFERVKAAGDSLICLPIASSLSGTYQSAVIAREMCGYPDIHVVDSTQTTLGLRLLVDLACLLRDQGVGADGIVRQLEQARHRVRLLAVMDTLKYLHKGGRLPAAASIAGELLKVKPIITLRDSRLSLAGKGVGARGSLSALVRLLGSRLEQDSRLPVYYGYTADKTLCRELMDQTRAAFGRHRCEVHPVGPVVGAHVGPGAAVIVYLKQAQQPSP